MSPAPGRVRALQRLAQFVLGAALLTALGSPARAGTVTIPNASFESPPVPQADPFAIPEMESWQKSAQPGWYDPSQNYDTPWDYLLGTFYNVPYPGIFIDNCDGIQAAFLFGLPDVAIFQDYDSIDGTNTTPSHEFNALFSVGNAYGLTVGLIGGVDGTPPLYEGATLQISLYYRDASSNMVTVAARSITNSTGLFPTNTHFVDFAIQLPTVQPTDPWAGQHIGVRIASTVGFDLAGGYWDVDNVRLTETAVPVLANPQMTENGFSLTLVSVPGLRFEILASTNASLALSNWTSLGNVTNDLGATVFLDPAPNITRRFYSARQLP
jgi:hypothetical protein